MAATNNMKDHDDGYNIFLDLLSALPDDAAVNRKDKEVAVDDVEEPKQEIEAVQKHNEPPKHQLDGADDNVAITPAATPPLGNESKANDSNGHWPKLVQQQLLDKAEEEDPLIGPLTKFYLIYLGIPSLLVAWYAAAILFPPGYRAKYPALLWTDGALTYEDDGTPEICPRTTICSEGVVQIILITISRLTAFVGYIFMAFTFWSKMHNMSHALSNTYCSMNFPFPHFHEVHKFSGGGYAVLAILHTIGHIIRWILRSEMVS